MDVENMTRVERIIDGKHKFQTYYVQNVVLKVAPVDKNRYKKVTRNLFP